MKNQMAENDKERIEEMIKQNLDQVPGKFICRDQIGKVTGGALKPRHCANLDSKGEGIPGGFYLGRRKCYPKSEIFNFLVSRVRTGGEA